MKAFKSLLKFIETHIHPANAVENLSALDWFLILNLFWYTKNCFIQLQSFFKLCLIVKLIAFILKLVGRFNCNWLNIDFSFPKFQFFGPSFQHFHQWFCNHCCKIKFFLWRISLVNSHQFILSLYINWGSTLTPKSINIIKYSFVTDWMINIRVGEKAKWMPRVTCVAWYCQLYFLA